MIMNILFLIYFKITFSIRTRKIITYYKNKNESKFMSVKANHFSMVTKF